MPKCLSYQKPHCWQYQIRLQNLEDDLKQAQLKKEEVKNLKVRDFKIDYVTKENKNVCAEVRSFIECHEWLGKMPLRPTHRFVARYKGLLAGVVVMATPNSFSHLLGRENRDKEKLISRGACISWSPKNLGSALVMFAVKWMVKNTSFRYFSAYSDTEARELGTIYQACNFKYLGQTSGARFEYFDPLFPERGWFSDRLFRKTGQIKRYAKELEIEWEVGWGFKDKIFWDNIPDSIRWKIKQLSIEHQKRCQRRALPRKHKYIYILGRSKNETRQLLSLFEKHSPELVGLAYPKIRGTGPNLIRNRFDANHSRTWTREELAKAAAI